MKKKTSENILQVLIVVFAMIALTYARPGPQQNIGATKPIVEADIEQLEESKDLKGSASYGYGYYGGGFPSYYTSSYPYYGGLGYSGYSGYGGYGGYGGYSGYGGYGGYGRYYGSSNYFHLNSLDFKFN